MLVMPELPEVQTIVSQLQRSLPGQIVASVLVSPAKVFRTGGRALKIGLRGRRIERVGRQGKRIVIELSRRAAPVAPAPRGCEHRRDACATGATLVVHLGMTGNLLVVPADEPVRKHTHLRVRFDGDRGAPGLELRFVDPRKFGGVWFMDDARGDSCTSGPSRAGVDDARKDSRTSVDSAAAEFVRGKRDSRTSVEGARRDSRTRVRDSRTSGGKRDSRTSVPSRTSVDRARKDSRTSFGPHSGPYGLRELGPDALDIRVPVLRAVLRRRRQIKALLLDQQAVSGLGNIYCDEALFSAGIHPLTQASDLNERQVRALAGAIRKTLRESIAFGGTTISDYRDAGGKTGEFQHRLRVYGREGEPCPRCGTTIQRILAAGRSSHICPRCQRRSLGRQCGRARPLTDSAVAESVKGKRDSRTSGRVLCRKASR